MSASPSPISSDDAKRKMRKGTHSCTECRRRKKSCIPRQESPGTCAECFARGVQCREQEASLRRRARPHETKQSLQQRVKELETALQTIVHTLKGSSNAAESGILVAGTIDRLRPDVVHPTPGSPGPDSPPDSLLENAPIFSLFDNAILSRRREDEIGPATSDDKGSISKAGRGSSPKIRHIRKTLLSLFPSQPTQDAILSTATMWWTSWQELFPYILGPDPSSNLAQFITESRFSGNIQKIAKALLCLSISLQEAPETLKALQYDSLPSQEQPARTIQIIDQLILSDDEVAGTIDGIECIILRAEHDSNNGRVRRAWLLFRKAIGFAQLLGLHIPPKGTDQGGTEALRKESLWNALNTYDRYLSFLLGLPYAISDSQINMTKIGSLIDEPNPGRLYLLHLGSIIGHVIDRNQESDSGKTLLLTFKIENEMVELASRMPKEWWSFSGFNHKVMDMDMNSTREVVYSRFLPAFWHYQVRTLLHLPFMLKATTDRRYEYNKIAALESAREMIYRYRIFRPIQGFGSLVCKVIDFQIFTAAMVLVLNLLGRSQSASEQDSREAREDQELVSVTTEILHRASVETLGGVATQAARALSIFSKAGDRTFLAGQATSKVVIPYFGTVVFGPGKSFGNNKHASGHEPSATMPTTSIQVPTPSASPPDAFIQDPWDFETFLAAQPSSDSSGNNGLAMQEPQDDTDMTTKDPFSNVNLDLEQDWSWFWGNMDIGNFAT